MKSLQELYLSNLNAVCNTGGKFCCPADFSWECGTHVFEQNKFYFVTEGKCSITVGETEYTVRPGQWFFIPAGVAHSYYSFPGCAFQKYWMHFDLLPSGELAELLKLPILVEVPNDSVVFDLFAQAAKAMKSHRLTDRIRLKSCLLALIAEYIDLAYPADVVIEKTDSRIDQVLRYIGNHLDQALSVPELARQFHLHPTYFIRFFKEKTGQTPTRYIRDQRMETAKRLLESTQLYISTVMVAVGFDDESQFSKQFKKYYGLSPRNYRKYCQKDL